MIKLRAKNITVNQKRVGSPRDLKERKNEIQNNKI